jgi:hypothetical protein
MQKIDLFDNTQVLFADVPTPILIVPKSTAPEIVRERVASIEHFWNRTLNSPRVLTEMCDEAQSACPQLPSVESLDHAFSWYSHFNVDVDEAINDIRDVLLSGTCEECAACARFKAAVDECINQYFR